MEFFEGKRVRELRSTYEDALEKTLEPQTLEVRRDPPCYPASPVDDRPSNTRGTTRGKMSASRASPSPQRSCPDLPSALPVNRVGVSAALSGLDAEMHEPLYDLYCQLLQGISTFSLDEFDPSCARRRWSRA